MTKPKTGTELFFIAGYPRSGLMLLRLAIEEMLDLPTYTYELERRHFGLETDNRHIATAHFTEVGGAVFVKTNEIFHADTTTRAIYVVRDGRDALVSLAHYLIDVDGLQGDFTKTLQALVESPEPDYGGWSNHYMRWTKREGKTVVIRYEDLYLNPRDILAGVCEELGLPKPHQNASIRPFKFYHDNWPNYYRRGKPDAWRDEMPKHIHDAFMDRHGDQMKELNYA